MKLSQGIYGFLARNYGSILRKCALLNAGLMISVALSAPVALAASAEESILEVTGKNSQLASSNPVNKIRVTSPSGPYSLSIDKGTFRLIGRSQDASLKALPLVVNTSDKAVTADINVIAGSLHLGVGTAAPGGTLEGQITLDNGSVVVKGGSSGYYFLNKGSSSGAITLKSGSMGALELVNRGQLQTAGDVGSADSPLTNVTLDGGRLDIGANTGKMSSIYADTIMASAGAQVTVQGDIEANAVQLNDASRLYANSGDIRLGSIQSDSSAQQAYQWNNIMANRGSIYIGGEVNGKASVGAINITEGLLNIIADQDIVFARPDIVANHGNGALFLKTEKGSLTVANDTGASFDLGDANVSALTMRIKGDVSAGSLNVSELSAKSINTIGDAVIHGGSTTIGGAPTPYGSLTLTGGGSNTVGGNLDLLNIDLRTQSADITVDGSAAISRTDGNFGALNVAQDLTVNGGALAGNSVKARSIELGGGMYATAMRLDTLNFTDSLTAGQGAALTVGNIDTNGGEIVSHGGSITSGNAGSQDNPLGGITLNEGSELTSTGASGIWTKNLSIDSATLKAEAGNINATGNDISVANATLNAPGLTLGNQRSTGKFANSQIIADDNVTFAGNMLFDGSNRVQSGGDIIANGSLSDNGSFLLDLVAAGDIKGAATIEAGNVAAQAVDAQNLTASSLQAEILNMSGNVAISGGSMVLDGRDTSRIAGNLTIDRGNVRTNAASSFGNLEVGGAVNIADSNVTGDWLAASSLTAAGSSATTVSIGNLESNTNVNIGNNAFVTLGSTDPGWLESGISGLGANSGAAGIYSPIVLGGNGGFNLGTAPSDRTRASGDLSFAHGSMLFVSGATAYEGANPAGMISASSPKTANVDNGARLQINGVASNKVYVVLGDNITTQYAGNEAWEGTNLGTDSHVLRLEKVKGRDGSFIARAVRPYPGLDSGIGDIIGGDTYPTTPIIPALPNIPSSPDSPTTPDNSGTNTPTTPTTPDNSGTNTPTTPTTPGNPGTNTPTTPTTPGNPGTNTPTTPTTPDNPGTNIPTTPATPDNQGPAIEIGTEDQHLYSPWGGIKFLSRVTSTKYMDHDYDLAVKTLESAARMVVLGAVPQMTASANGAASESAAMRMSFSSGAGMQEDAYGLDGRNIALWIMPMFRNVAGYNLTANNFGYDFYGGLGGVAFGGDWTWLLGDDLLRLGLNFDIGGGYAQSGGDLARTTNNMGFWGAGIYAAWLHGNFGLAADAQFTASWNSLKQDLPARLEMDDLEGDVTASAISAGLRAEYKIPLGNWELTPHAGFRYMYLTTDNYTFYSDGAVMDGEAAHQNIWTFPIGLSLAGLYETDSGWQIRPKLDLSAIPAAGDMNARTNIQFIGTSRNATVETQIMDYFTGQASLGLEFSKNDFSLGVAYTVQAGMKTVSQSVFGSLRYEF